MVPLGEYGYKNLKHLIWDNQGRMDGRMDTQSLKYYSNILKIYSSILKYTQVLNYTQIHSRILKYSSIPKCSNILKYT